MVKGHGFTCVFGTVTVHLIWLGRITLGISLYTLARKDKTCIFTVHLGLQERKELNRVKLFQCWIQSWEIIPHKSVTLYFLVGK